MPCLMCNNMQDAKAKINNALCVSATLRLCVELKNKNAETQRRDGAKNESHSVGDCVVRASVALVPMSGLTTTKVPILHRNHRS